MPNILRLFVLMALFSCSNGENTSTSATNTETLPTTEVSEPVTDQVFTVEPNSLTKDFMTWYKYMHDHVNLSKDFIGLDSESKQLDKLAFLKKLTTGQELPFKTRLEGGIPVYTLYKVSAKDASIKSTMQDMAAAEMKHYKMEGTTLPDFNFTDINGKHYTKENTEGKIVLVKCWFIRCVACVKEFPELNRLVDQYQDRSDVLFVSLAMDSKKELEAFLTKRDFKYAVVADKKSYMANTLGVMVYPTHFLLDASGKIVKVVTKIEDLLPNFEKELAKQSDQLAAL